VFARADRGHVPVQDGSRREIVAEDHVAESYIAPQQDGFRLGRGSVRSAPLERVDEWCERGAAARPVEVVGPEAELGFVALSQLAGNPGGSRWLVPQGLYAPIRQDAVLLKKGASNPAATAFVGFLRGPEARAIIEKYGYAFGGQS
jgi:hypothetical protein